MQIGVSGVFVLSGGIKLDPLTGQYVSPGFGDLDAHGLISGGRVRVEASAILARIDPQLILVTTTHFYAHEPTHASVMCRELIELGVASERILLEEKSCNSLTELIEMVKMSAARDWPVVGVLSSEYHLERLQILWQYLPQLNDPTDLDFGLAWRTKRPKVIFMGAEPILQVSQPGFAAEYARIKETVGFQKRVAAERQGVEDILKGKYRVYRNVPQEDLVR